MLIREFEESDSDAVVALWTAVFGYAKAHNDPAVAIRQKLALQRKLFFVAATDDEVVGTVMAGYDGHRGWIYSLAVKPESRRRGIGGALVQHAEKSLLALGCMKVNLQVMPANQDVVRFYEKLGFAVEERISMGKVL